jgi:Membrane protein involved in colicin uptake
MFCPNCKKPIIKDWRFCPYCTVKLPPHDNDGRRVSKIKKLVIAAGAVFIFLFVVGAVVTLTETPDEKQARQLSAQVKAQERADKQAAEQAKKQAEKEAKERIPMIKREIASKAEVEAKIDYFIMDSKDNNKVGVFFKNNSDYRIKKGSVTILLKDAAGNTVDTDTLSFTRPVDPHMGSAGILWMKCKRVTQYATDVSINEFEEVQ